MSGITIEGLTPSRIEPCGEHSPYDVIRIYVIGEITLRVGITYMTPHPWATFLDADWDPIHMGGYTGWSTGHPDGDHIGSPYWALSSAIYGLARIWEEHGGQVRWDDPSEGPWDRIIISRF